MIKIAWLVTLLIVLALVSGCDDEPRHDPPFILPTPTKVIPTARPTLVRPPASPTAVQVANRVKVVSDPVKPSTTFSARQKPVAVPALSNCAGWYNDEKGVGFQLTDEGQIQLQVNFTFEVIDRNRALVPNLFFIYSGDYVYVERKGTETFLFRVDEIRVGQGVHITLGGSGC